jgi:hypothetical protein
MAANNDHTDIQDREMERLLSWLLFYFAIPIRRQVIELSSTTTSPGPRCPVFFTMHPPEN